MLGLGLNPDQMEIDMNTHRVLKASIMRLAC
jgi:hypothetical protein